LKKRYEIENLLIQISSGLINGKSQELESEFSVAISRFGEFLDAVKAEILVFNGEADQIEVLTAWSASENEPGKLMLAKEELQLIFENQLFLKKGKVRLVSPDVPVLEARDAGNLRILIPMISRNRLLGLVRFESNAPGFSFEEKE